MPRVNYKEFDIKKLNFTEIKTDKKFTLKQYLSFPKYAGNGFDEKDEPLKNEQLYIQSPWFELNSYGLQKKNDYFPTNESRNFLKVGYDSEQQNLMSFKSCLEQIDTHVLANEKSILFPFSSNNNKFIYNRMVKNSNNEKYPDYTKFKFDVDWNTKEIRTKVFVDKQNQYVKNINDMEKIVTYRSQVRLLFKVSKLWLSKSVDSITKTRKYGLTLKIMQMEVMPNEQRKTILQEFEDYAFSDQ